MRTTLPGATATAQIPISSVPVVAVPKRQNYSSNQSPQPAAPEAIDPAFSTSSVPARLTEEQSGLVQGLIRHNVPLPTVVDAIEGMMRGEERLDGSRLTQSNERPEADGPPDYNLV
jgi:hypothetical protein